ncbi:MAG: transposase [Microcystis wesenbergii Mw_QC_S_20081001_S30D]|jgi:putative transposase|uniref:Transposase n=1 Tax=Microcystis wesenbergii Mw_QC_S_20081001_S30D TaxID=2486245 RepID=A0A552JQ85_9CHRO|nr:IS200/IS605 family element transposase accessory protein TnpB [Microcystis aeruginosa W11-03]NCR93579.1 IS200/IS605 family element transposase accessory protein TnpB [Microcystis aeruginosa W11-06]TRU95964.1 MAG: transposase [Microcystis wesenbergii Mw_QC_B_20070930_S4D]TRU97902.1 MAG: transposase [Microcystis wesenbergii Mw_QC_S_20081001_S30D]TRV04325.1 MAG: transposase [Microcystis wesenbergii Mw_QC_S_20081001_S30]TRV15489.1 MAG: transposase [Microcystis wesenbergii Mw_QC_B_20070930_S4]
MKLAERHIIKRGHAFWDEIDQLSWSSKNLYNSANYLSRQNFIYGHGYLTYNQMDKLMQKTEQYQALPAKVSQQVLRRLDQNWKSFFEANQAYKVDPSKFLGRPKIPKYKDTKKGRNLLIYNKQAISKVALKQGKIKLSGTRIEFATSVSEQIAEVRIVPRCDCYVIEVIYEQIEQTLTQNDWIASVDLGVDVLMAVTSNQPGFIPLLINGRPLKSLNQFSNKRKAILQSQLKGNQKTSKRIQRLTRCRNQKVDNYLHRASRYLVNLLLEKNITTLVIGKNDGWKQNSNMGKANNQKFIGIPYNRLIEMLTYKCQLVGIKVVVTEESYTSQSNFFNLDPLPVYGETEEIPKFTGKRIKRGLYRTQTGFLCQSDVLASYNTLRKAFPNAFSYGIARCVVHPRRINLSKPK